MLGWSESGGLVTIDCFSQLQNSLFLLSLLPPLNLTSFYHMFSGRVKDFTRGYIYIFFFCEDYGLKENYVRFFISLYYTKCDPNMACPLSMDGNISVKPKSKILLFELR